MNLDELEAALMELGMAMNMNMMNISKALNNIYDRLNAIEKTLADIEAANLIKRL
jgi:hypothetical protein